MTQYKFILGYQRLVFLGCMNEKIHFRHLTYFLICKFYTNYSYFSHFPRAPGGKIDFFYTRKNVRVKEKEREIKQAGAKERTTV